MEGCPSAKWGVLAEGLPARGSLGWFFFLATSHLRRFKYSNLRSSAASYPGRKLVERYPQGRAPAAKEELNPLVSQVECMELLLDKLSKTRSNNEFLASMSG